MYLGELASKNLRGALGIMPQLFITIGILCAQVLGIRHILGNNTGIYDWGGGDLFSGCKVNRRCPGWTLMLGLTAIPAVVQLLLLPFFPESPRYLLIQRGDEKTAQKGERLSRYQKRVKRNR